MTSNQDPLTPEQRKNLTTYLSNGMRLIHSEQTRDMVVRRLKIGDPADAVAEQTLTIILQLERDGEKKGVPLDESLKGLVASELMGQIIEVGEAAGIFKMDEKQIRAAAGKAVGKYFQVQLDSGKMTMEQVKAMSERFHADADAEDAGKGGGPMAGPEMNQPGMGGSANV
jgi:hypothetical protein